MIPWEVHLVSAMRHLMSGNLVWLKFLILILWYRSPPGMSVSPPLKGSLVFGRVPLLLMPVLKDMPMLQVRRQ